MSPSALHEGAGRADRSEAGAAMTGTKQTNIRALIDASLASGEKLLRPADRLDYLIRRWLIPIRLEPSARREEEAFLRSSVILTELQAAIGRCLRAEYDIAQPIPPRLLALANEVIE